MAAAKAALVPASLKRLTERRKDAQRAKLSAEFRRTTPQVGLASSGSSGSSSGSNNSSSSDSDSDNGGVADDNYHKHEPHAAAVHKHHKLRWKSRTLFITLGRAGAVLRWQKIGARAGRGPAAIAAAAAGSMDEGAPHDKRKWSLPLLDVMAVVESLGVCPRGHPLHVTVSGEDNRVVGVHVAVVKRKAGTPRLCVLCKEQPIARPGDGVKIMLGCAECGYEVCRACAGKPPDAPKSHRSQHIALACQSGRVLRICWGDGKSASECFKAAEGLRLLEMSNRRDVHGGNERSDAALTALLNV